MQEQRTVSGGPSSSLWDRLEDCARATGGIFGRRMWWSRRSRRCGCGPRRASVTTGRVRHHADLETAPSRGANLPAAQGTGVAAGRLRRCVVCGWSSEPSHRPAGGRRLIPFPHLLIRPLFVIVYANMFFFQEAPPTVSSGPTQSAQPSMGDE